MRSFLSGAGCMLRVIYALALREVHTLYGGTTLGYVWCVIRIFFVIAFVWVIRRIMHFHVPHHLTLLNYLACGFFVWFVVTETLIKNMSAISGNKNLLTFPQVFPLDIMIARALVVTTTNLVTILLILAAGFLVGNTITLEKIDLFILSVCLACTFGLGVGAILSALSAFIPALLNIVPLSLRIFLLASGVFLPIELFDNVLGKWIYYNPILQIIEMLRSSISAGYISELYNLEYLLFVNLSVLSIGFLLERYVRKRLMT